MSPHPTPSPDLETSGSHGTVAAKPLSVITNPKGNNQPAKSPLLKLKFSKKSPRGFIKSLTGRSSTPRSSSTSNGQSQIAGSSPKVFTKKASDTKGQKRSGSSAGSSTRTGRSRSRGGRHQIFAGCTGGQRSRSCTPERNSTLSCKLPVGHIPPDLLNLPLSVLHPGVQPDVTRSSEDPLGYQMDISKLKLARPASGNPTPFDRQVQHLLNMRSMGVGCPLEDVTNLKSSSKPHMGQDHLTTKDSRHINHVNYPVMQSDEKSVYSKATALPKDSEDRGNDSEECEKDKSFSKFSFKRFSFRRKSTSSKNKKNNEKNACATDAKHEDIYDVPKERNEYVKKPSADVPQEIRKRSRSADRRRDRDTKKDSDYYNGRSQRQDAPDIPRAVRRTKSFQSAAKSMKDRPLPPLPTEASEMTHYAERAAPPPPQGSVTLIRTINLDRVVKNKWISGLAVTKKNEYIIVDLKGAYVVDDDGVLKRLIGSKGHNKLSEPIDVTVMCNGNLAFSDHADQDVKIFNWKGQFLRRVKDQALTNIAGVTSNSRREIIIAGTDKQRVSVHSEDDELLYTLPSDKDSRLSFEHPYTVAVNPLTQDIIVGDDYKQLVTALSSDGRKIMWRFSPSGGRERHFFPSSICVDNDGYIFIADLYNEKVYMLDSSGKFLKTLLSRGDGLKGGPGAIATDGQGHLLVADEERTLKVFKYGENGFALYRRTSYGPGAHVHKC